MKAVLIDDEPLALDYLQYQLSLIEDYEIIGQFTDPCQGKEMIEKKHVDVAFLDIEFPALNGIELAERLIEKKPDLNIVFVTAYQEYAIEAFEVSALDYLLKPVQKERLLKTTERLKKRMTHLTDDVITPHTRRLYMTLLKQVSIFYDQEKMTFKWRTAKAQELFLYLLHHRTESVDKSELIELLWPDLEQKKHSPSCTQPYIILEKRSNLFVGMCQSKTLAMVT